MATTIASSSGCSSERQGYEPPPACPVDNPLCQGSPTGGSTGSGAGGGSTTSGAGGSAQAGLAEGTVRVLVDEAFELTSPYTGDALIVAPAPGGQVVSAPYGGAAGTSFSLDGVLGGTVWLFVQDQTNGAGGIVSTWSPHSLPDSALELPVVDRNILANIVLSLGLPSLSFNGAQIVLKVERGLAPLAGVSVAGVSDGTVLYDQGAGVYSDLAAATGNAGTIVILEAGGAGDRTIELVDESNVSFPVTIPVTPGTATFAHVGI